jgi:hypothetical protein
MPGLAGELDAAIIALKTRVAPVLAYLKQQQQQRPLTSSEDDAAVYLEVKQQLLMSYSANLAFYLLLKVCVHKYVMCSVHEPLNIIGCF